jgi:hypothetical protein
LDRAGSEWSEQWPLPRARSVDTELAIEDAVTAQGITDAFHDAELITNALDDAFAGRRSQDEALAAYELNRDRSTRPMFDLTCQLGANDPPSDEEAELFALIASRWLSGERAPDSGSPRGGLRARPASSGIRLGACGTSSQDRVAVGSVSG